MGGQSFVNITAGLEREYRYYGPEGEVPDPALFIWNRANGFHLLAIVPLNCAYKYNPRTQADVLEATDSARNIAMTLNLPTDSRSLAKLVIWIGNQLSPLFSMPPWSEARKVIGQATIIEGGTTFTADILE